MDNDPILGDAFGTALLSQVSGSGSHIVIERDDGFVDVDGSDYFSIVTDDPLWQWLRPRLATYTPEPAAVPEALPEGFDARITFDGARARARRWPAIDPDRTSVGTYPDERHEHIARAARAALADYAAVDPTFALADPSAFDDPAAAEQAQALVRYLTHSFRVVELFYALPAVETPIAEILDSVEDLLGL